MRIALVGLLVVVAGCSAGGSDGPPSDAGGTPADASTGALDALSPPPDGSAATTTCPAAESCTGHIPIGSWTLPYLSTAALETPNPAFDDLVIFIEGLNRDAANDFSTIVTAAMSASALAHTLVVVPEFQALTDSSGAACSGHADTPAATDLVWQCSTWSDGLFAVNAPTVSSYGALDVLLADILAGQPSIRRVTVAGFSAGGQLTQRYVAANHSDRAAGGPAFRYVVGDPSSYVYFDARRPVNAAGCTASGCPDGFVPFVDAGGCPGFDDWKYGTNALQGAAAGFTPTALEGAYVARPVTYLLGMLDNAATTAADYAQLDVSCAGEAQGPFRYQRGLAFFAYATTLLDAGASSVSMIPGCAHSPSCVFQSDAGVAAVFAP